MQSGGQQHKEVSGIIRWANTTNNLPVEVLHLECPAFPIAKASNKVDASDLMTYDAGNNILQVTSVQSQMQMTGRPLGIKVVSLSNEPVSL